MKHDNQAAKSTLPASLIREIDDCGFFPQLVCDSVGQGVGDEAVEAFLVHHEATFAHDGIARHLSVLVLTATRLIVSHTDDHTDDPQGGGAVSSLEAVPTRLLGAVALSKVVARPECFGTDAAEVVETWLTMSWNTVRKVDLEPASCGDPNCEADHGFTGSNVAEDMVIRMSAAADGPDQVNRLIAFGTALQRRVR